nr:unnamed protein product [Schizosaccharomyces pombe]
MELIKKIQERDAAEKAYYDFIEPYSELLEFSSHKEFVSEEKVTPRTASSDSLNTIAGENNDQNVINLEEFRQLKRNCDLYQRNLQKLQLLFKQQSQKNTLLEKQLSLPTELNQEKDQRVKILQDELWALQLEVAALERKSPNA